MSKIKQLLTVIEGKHPFDIGLASYHKARKIVLKRSITLTEIESILHNYKVDIFRVADGITRISNGNESYDIVSKKK